MSNIKKVTLRAFAKINLSIDVLGKMENGYHQVDMIMQQVSLYDKVTVSWEPALEFSINLSTNRKYLPNDNRNLAFVAAEKMIEYAIANRNDTYTGKITIDIEKRIPVAAGLAGGSSNCAAVLLALNHLWNLNLNVAQLSSIGAPLGSDVPFSIMGLAKSNKLLGDQMNKDPLAASCARARGTGTTIEPIRHGLEALILLTKPPIKVSTKEVYTGLRLDNIIERPNNEELIQGLKEKNLFKVTKNMINVLEIYTLKRYPIVMYTKNKVSETGNPLKVLMSGSGPTIFAIYTNKNKAKSAADYLKKENRDTYLTRTTP